MAKTHIAVILDMSGSMQATVEETKQGLRTYIKETRKEVPDALFSLTVFNSSTHKWINSEIINSLRTKEVVRNYRPNGWTALYDAIGITVNDLERKVKRNDKAIVVIMTDGYENSSIRYKDYDIKSLVTRLQNKGNWTFVFLGANIDSWALSRNLGFYQTNTVDYSYGQGQVSAFKGTAHATANLVASASPSSAAFYEDAGVNTNVFNVDEVNKPILIDKDDKVVSKSK